MKIIKRIRQMQAFSMGARFKGETIGFVPTMGALHEGHLSLIRQARQNNDTVVVSIFVNPAQFGPREDFKKYPRDLKNDAKLCRKENVDVIFHPNAKEMYPQNYKTYVAIGDLDKVLCGKFRSGHFRGVATIVVKLLNIVQPDVAYFGQKDAQQAIIIKRVAGDLNIPVRIKVMPTLREPNGLALSSRNIYLSPQGKKDALVLFQALDLARRLLRQGNKKSSDIIRRMRRLINQKKNALIQYISIVDLEDLAPVAEIEGAVLIALAVWIGKTRLIDNIIIKDRRDTHPVGSRSVS